MAQIENLEEWQIRPLEQVLKEMQLENKELSWNFIPQVELDKAKVVENEELRRIEEKVDTLSRKIDLIFGDFKLMRGIIDGKGYWMKIK